MRCSTRSVSRTVPITMPGLTAADLDSRPKSHSRLLSTGDCDTRLIRSPPRSATAQADAGSRRNRAIKPGASSTKRHARTVDIDAGRGGRFLVHLHDRCLPSSFTVRRRASAHPRDEFHHIASVIPLTVMTGPFTRLTDRLSSVACLSFHHSFRWRSNRTIGWRTCCCRRPCRRSRSPRFPVREDRTSEMQADIPAVVSFTRRSPERSMSASICSRKEQFTIASGRSRPIAASAIPAQGLRYSSVPTSAAIFTATSSSAAPRNRCPCETACLRSRLRRADSSWRLICAIR